MSCNKFFLPNFTDMSIHKSNSNINDLILTENKGCREDYVLKLNVL